MKIKLDLRPREIVVAAQKKVDVVRLLSLALICIFPFMTGTSLVYSFLLLHELEGEQRNLSSSVEALKARQAVLNEELSDLEHDAKLYKKSAAFAKDELPVLECLSAVEAALLDVMWLSRMEINPGRAVLQGYAMTEGEVVEFARGLLASPVIPNVDLPVTQRAREDLTDVVKFSLNCSLKSLGDLGGGAKGALFKE